MRLIGLVGWSGSGKTTLISWLLPILRDRGLSLSTIKHAHHGFDIDRPGKDSRVHREHGATEVLVVSTKRWALMHELREESEPDLIALISHLCPVDLVLVEGFKCGSYPKIEVYRPSIGKPLLQPNDPEIVAVACDVPLGLSVPSFALDDSHAIADFIEHVARPISNLA